MSQTVQTHNIKSPKCETIEFMDFSLAEIDEKFIIAPFERRTSDTIISKIVKSIRINKFFDNFFLGEKGLDGKITIYDGQHRLAALKVVRDEDCLTNYDIKIHIYPNGVFREIYRMNLQV